MEDTENLIKELRRLLHKIYASKNMITTVRLDYPTSCLIEELSKGLGISKGEVMRLSVWLTAILLDPSTTVKRVFEKEAIKKIKKGEDIALIDALKGLGKVLEEEMEKYTKKEVTSSS